MAARPKFSGDMIIPLGNIESLRKMVYREDFSEKDYGDLMGCPIKPAAKRSKDSSLNAIVNWIGRRSLDNRYAQTRDAYALALAIVVADVVPKDPAAVSGSF